MIIPKRRIVFYFILLTSVAWVYLATYYLFNSARGSELDILARSNGFSKENNYAGLENTSNEGYVYATYDKTPDRNPDKPGEWGAGVTLNFLEKEKEKEGYAGYAFNRAASDKISLERNLLDLRNSK